MTRVYGITDSQKEIGTLTNDSEAICSYEFSRSKWNYTSPTSAEVDEWSCPYTQEPESEYCIFHQPIEEKGMGDIYEKIEELTNEHPDIHRYPFIGAQIGTLDLGELPSGEVGRYSVLDFRNSIIQGEINSDRNTIDYGIDLSGSEIHDKILISNTVR